MSLYERTRCGICHCMLTSGNCDWHNFPGVCVDCGPPGPRASGYREPHGNPARQRFEDGQSIRDKGRGRGVRVPNVAHRNSRGNELR